MVNKRLPLVTTWNRSKANQPGAKKPGQPAVSDLPVPATFVQPSFFPGPAEHPGYLAGRPSGLADGTRGLVPRDGSILLFAVGRAI